MNAITQHYIIDFSSNNNFVQVPAMQGDGNETRFVEIEMIENGVPYLVDSETDNVTIAGTKPDGTEVWNLCEVTSSGTIKVNISYQMTAVAGKSDYVIVIFKKESNQQLKSFPFILLVTQATYDPGYIISSDEFEALAQYTTAAAVAADAAAASAADAALAGSICVMHIEKNTGHLICEKVDKWRGNFELVDNLNLLVHWE